MPTMAQVAKIADYVYNTSGIGAKEDKDDLTLDYDKVASLGFTQDSSGSFYVCSGEEDSKRNAYYRYFYPTRTQWTSYSRRTSGLQAVCLAD